MHGAPMLGHGELWAIGSTPSTAAPAHVEPLLTGAARRAVLRRSSTSAAAPAPPRGSRPTLVGPAGLGTSASTSTAPLLDVAAERARVHRAPIELRRGGCDDVRLRADRRHGRQPLDGDAVRRARWPALANVRRALRPGAAAGGHVLAGGGRRNGWSAHPEAGARRSRSDPARRRPGAPVALGRPRRDVRPAWRSTPASRRSSVRAARVRRRRRRRRRRHDRPSTTRVAGLRRRHRAVVDVAGRPYAGPAGVRVAGGGVVADGDRAPVASSTHGRGLHRRRRPHAGREAGGSLSPDPPGRPRGHHAQRPDRADRHRPRRRRGRRDGLPRHHRPAGRRHRPHRVAGRRPARARARRDRRPAVRLVAAGGALRRPGGDGRRERRRRRRRRAEHVDDPDQLGDDGHRGHGPARRSSAAPRAG